MKPLPAYVIGTHGMNYQALRPVIMSALECGIRAFDTARQYGNEDVVGQAIHDSLKATGIDRTKIFITTKLWYTTGLDQLEESLRCLSVDYVDLCLIHYPYPGWFVPAYHRLEKSCAQGKTLRIGVSNFRIRHFDELFADKPEIHPSCIQFERHPLRTVPELTEYCRSKQIAIQAQSPLCVMDSRIRDSHVLGYLAEKYGKSIPQIVLKWHLQNGVCPVVRSTNPKRVKENFVGLNFDLTEDDMQDIDSMNENFKMLLESVYCPGF